MSASDQPIVHTPDPWSLLCDESRGRPRCLVVDAKGNEIASVNPYRESWNQDAELIADATKMLEMIEELADHMVLHGGNWRLREKAEEVRNRAIDMLNKHGG